MATYKVSFDGTEWIAESGDVVGHGANPTLAVYQANEKLRKAVDSASFAAAPEAKEAEFGKLLKVELAKAAEVEPEDD